MKKRKLFTTTRMIMMGFLVGIMIGTLLLMLPICSRTGTFTNFTDSLFMSTSSICVTGLATLTPVVHYNWLGQLILLILIQFGGLGVVTFTTVILIIVGRRITLTERMLIQDAYNLDTLSGLVRLTGKILKGSLIVEGIGALCYMTVFIPEYGPLHGIWKSIFTAVSAFCNAGLDLVGSDSLVPFADQLMVNITTMLLIIIGGIGFPVWWELIRVHKLRRRRRFRRSIWKEYNLHTKLVLMSTFVLIAVGTLLTFLMEYDNPDTIGNLNLGNKLLASLFQSVTLRTAGFATIPQGNFRHVTSLVFIVWMFIGGSPSGTAGGVKTVTVSLLLISTISILRGHKELELYGRKIVDSYLRKAIAVITFSFSCLVVLTIALMYVQDGDFLDTIYEMTSAIATVGLSRGMTGELHRAGKYIVIIAMYLGRIGPISLALVFNAKTEKKNTSCAESKIIVG